MTKKSLTFLLSVVLSQLIYSQAVKDSLKVSLAPLDVQAYQQQLRTGTGRALIIIERAEINKLPVRSVDELLDVVSGVDVRQRGVGGTQSDVSVRGGSFDQVLVLLNGVNITDPQTGHYNLDVPIELSDISRVELLQGSAARIYGPNAFSGAINIITDKEGSKLLSAQLSAGSFGTYTQNVSGTIGSKKINSFNSLSNKWSNGYISNTDYKIFSLFSHTSLITNKAGKFDFQLAYQQKSYGANAFYSFKYPLQFDHTETFFSALSWQIRKRNTAVSSQAYFRKHYDRYELFRDSVQTKPAWYAGHNYHLTDVAGIKSTVTVYSSVVKTVFGFDVRNEHIYSNTLGNLMAQPVNNIFDNRADFTKEDNRLLTTAFVDFSKSFGKFNASVGGSATYLTQYKFLRFGGADVTYNFTDNMRMYLSYNNSINLPTFTDLYLQTSVNKGNVNLLPGKSSTLEVGIKYSDNQLKLNAAAYHREGKNVIDWVQYTANSKWESINHPELNAFGIDLMGQYLFRNRFLQSVTLAYSYINLNNVNVSFDSKYALDYLRHKLVFTANHFIYKDVSAQWKLSYNDRAGDYADFVSGNRIAYNPFLLADLRILWSRKHFLFFADINNILNKKYADYGGLIQPGVNLNAGIRLKIGKETAL